MYVYTRSHTKVYTYVICGVFLSFYNLVFVAIANGILLCFSDIYKPIDHRP